MWHFMSKKGLAVGALALAGLLFGTGASAATVSLNGAGEFVDNLSIGEDGTDTVTLEVNPDNEAVDIVSTTLSGAGITGFTVYDGLGSPVGSASQDPGRITSYSLRFAYNGVVESGWTIVVSGTNGAGYSIAAAAVPLPAAAWMFLSALFGGAWLKRRSARQVSASRLALAAA